MSNRQARTALFTAALGVVFAAVLLLPTLQIGVPAYVHDWTWPPDAEGLHAQLLQGWQPWLDDGIGRPNPFPTELPYFVALAWATPLLAPRVELGLLLVTVVAFAFIAGTVFARQALGLGWGAYVCGALYAAGPIVLTKLVAGHLSYLQAYAVFPVFALALRQGANSWRWCAAGALAAGITTLQAQFLGFDAAYALLALLCRAAPARSVARIGALSVPLMLPVLVGPTINAFGGAGTLAHQHANIAWEIGQSSDLLPALAGVGYFTDYVPRLALPHTIGLLAVVPILAILGTFITRFSAQTRALIASALVGWLLVVGLKGPLAPVLAAAFTGFTPASLFRELYDATVLIWLPLAGLAAAAFERLPPVAIAVAASALALVLVPPWARYGTYFAAPPSAQALAGVSRLVVGDAPGRVVWWPALQPIGPPTSLRGGTDPLARTPLGADLPLYEYQPQALDGTAVSLAANGRWADAAADFAWLGVRHVVVRDGLVSFASGEPRASAAPGHAMPLVGRSGAFAVYAVPEPRALITVEPALADGAPRLRAYDPSRTTTQPAPAVIVAAFPFLWRAPAAASCGPNAVIADGATLARSGSRWIFAAPYGLGPCSWQPAAKLAAQPQTFFVAGGSADAPSPVAVRPARPLSDATALRERPGTWQGVVDAPQAGLLVVRVAYDGRWRASADGRDLGPPQGWFGFPAWPIGAGPHVVVAAYGGGLPVIACLWIALGGLAACCVILALPVRETTLPGGSPR